MCQNLLFGELEHSWMRMLPGQPQVQAKGPSSPQLLTGRCSVKVPETLCLSPSHRIDIILSLRLWRQQRRSRKKLNKIAKAGPVDKGCQRLQKTHIELVIPNGIPHWWLSTAWSFNQQLKKTRPELVEQCLEKGQKCQIVATRTLYLKTN